MIELCDECEYTILIADLIATLMTFEKDEEYFKLKIWYNNTGIPFSCDSNCLLSFLQEGLRVEYDFSFLQEELKEYDSKITYLFYDLITSIEVMK